MPVKPSLREEEYFAREEASRRRKLADEQRARLAVEEGERERFLHFMKCPKCGKQLQELLIDGVYVDRCSGCQGIWLDQGELETIRTKNAGFLDSLMDVFR
jgi:uncharacterized protein